MSAIKIKNLDKSFAGVTLFNQFNFELSTGSLGLITGSNGKGKSTLLKIIAGAMKAKGEIEIDDSFCFIPAERCYDSFLTLKENALVLVQDQDLVDQMLIDWGLKDFQKTKMKDLSHGMQKRMLLGTFLTHNVAVFLFDEPLLHLDKDWIQVFIDKISKKIEQGASILIATHHPERFRELKPVEVNLNEL